MGECTPLVEQPNAPLRIIDILMEIEYFQEHIVGEHVDCHQASTSC